LPSVLGLSFASQSVSSVPSFVGVQFDTSTDVSDTTVLRSWLRAAWKHEFDTSRVAQASFTSAPGFAFDVQGAEPPADAAIARIGVELTVQGNVSIFANFDGELGAGAHSYGGTGGMKIAF
jgi:outer membrane autotransporter protein